MTESVCLGERVSGHTGTVRPRLPATLFERERVERRHLVVLVCVLVNMAAVKHPVRVTGVDTGAS